MKGVRKPNGYPAYQLAAGEYCYSEEYGCFMACTPDGRLANLGKHVVVEHSDGAITVKPSILVHGGGNDGSWHGYLTHGEWTED